MLVSPPRVINNNYVNEETDTRLIISRSAPPDSLPEICS
jgi:hypothetical protein